MRPYRGLLAFGLVTTFLASLLDGFTLVLLVPLLKHLFGTAGQLRAGLHPAGGPRQPGGRAAGRRTRRPARRPGGWWCSWSPACCSRTSLSYASTQITVRVQEGLVRDLRTQLFAHLLTLDLGFFQRTRAGPLISGIITEVDQTKTVITASLVSLFQNLVVVAVTLVILSQISLRLTLFTLAFVPLWCCWPSVPHPAAAAPRPGARPRAGRGHRDRHRAARRHPADPVLRRGGARGGTLSRRRRTAIGSG